MFKVRIEKSSYPDNWYANRIGDVFDVEIVKGNKIVYSVVDGNGATIIRNDCDILSSEECKKIENEKRFKKTKPAYSTEHYLKINDLNLETALMFTSNDYHFLKKHDLEVVLINEGRGERQEHLNKEEILKRLKDLTDLFMKKCSDQTFNPAYKILVEENVIQIPKRIYIAGKIGNLPEDVYKPRFEKGKEEVEAMGFIPVSPLEFPHNHKRDWASYMKEDLTEMFKCDAVYALREWRDSPGATIEVELATKLGINIIFQK